MCHADLLVPVARGCREVALSGVGPPETHHHTRVAVVLAEYWSRTLSASLQLCRKCNDATLRCAGRRFGEHAIVEHPGLEPRFHEAVQGRECLDLAEEGWLVDLIEA